MLLDDPVFEMSDETLLDQEVAVCQACCKASCIEVLKTLCTVQAAYMLDGNCLHSLRRHFCSNHFYRHSLPRLRSCVFVHDQLVEDFSHHLLPFRRFS